MEDQSKVPKHYLKITVILIIIILSVLFGLYFGFAKFVKDSVYGTLPGHKVMN